MDVDPSWLESEPEPPPPPPLVPRDLHEETAPAAEAKPAGPRRRETMEVQMDWLEPPEAGAESAGDRGGARAKKPVIPPLLLAKPRGKLPPPLPRSEPPEARRTSRPPRRTTRPPRTKGE